VHRHDGRPGSARARHPVPVVTRAAYEPGSLSNEVRNLVAVRMEGGLLSGSLIRLSSLIYMRFSTEPVRTRTTRCAGSSASMVTS
jgi:hypothetical protein